MRIVAIISEYNPFHKGHKYHLEMAKEISSSNYAIAIMSGSFLQRGEPALFDKWSRAKMAVLNGVDLVIELPVIYSCQPAENFAYGAMKILDSLNIVDCLCFGSETGDIDKLKNIASLLINEPKVFKDEIKEKIAKGLSYPEALSNTIVSILGDDVLTPNNILGIEYIKAKYLLKSAIDLYTIKRISNDYHDKNITSSISSATAIRNEIQNKGFTEALSSTVPPYTYDIIKKNTAMNKGPIFLDDFSDLILYQLRKMSITSLKKISHVKEGLEHRIKNQANKSGHIHQVIDLINTKRYTQSHIQRILFHSLLGINSKDTIKSKKQESQVYFRILGFNDNGREMLKEIKKSSPYPLITKTANFRSKDPFLNRMFYLDTLSTDIYNIAMKNLKFRKAKEDYFTSPLYIRNK